MPAVGSASASRGSSLVRGHLEVRGAEDERLIALVAAAVEQRRRLGVGARDDDAGTPMMSSWKRAALRRLICSSSGTRTLPPWWPHFFTPGF
jgi:hypothetical protein